MIRRQVHVGRMQYAPTLPTEKAIPNDWFRVKALRHSCGLSPAPDKSQPNYRMPIRRSRRKPSAIPLAYPLHRVIAFRITGGLSAALGNLQSIVRGVFRGGMQKHTLHRMYLARGAWFGAKDTWGVCNTPLPYRQKKLSLMIELWRLPSAISAAYPPLSTKALGDSVGLSAAPDESPPNQRRPIRRIE